MRHPLKHHIKVILRAITKYMIMLAFFACVGHYLERSRISTALENIQEAGELRVLSRNGPTTYFEGPHGMTGFEYKLSEAFAKHLGVKLVIEEEEDLAKMIGDLHGAHHAQQGDRAHMAAAGLTVTERRQKKVRFTAPYLQVNQLLLYRTGTKRPENIEDLYGKDILVVSNSSHVENLKKLQREHPTLAWRERHDVEMMDLMEMVHSGEIDFTIVDSNAYHVNGALYPRASIAFELSEAENIAWAFPKSQDNSLFNEAEKFFAKMQKNDYIADLNEQFYGHAEQVDIGASHTFSKRLNTRLPKWRDMLQEAAEANDMDWQLLAAISYQESHWNPKAISRTGVRGFMMLTRTTAKELGVKNRTNAKASIEGGAKYFKQLYNRLPERLSESDRTWFALAAYNMGIGHVRDARILTERLEGNPDKWTDVRDNLELLSKRQYYKSLKHGYARGWEAISYVQNIRNFYNIIAWHEKENLQQIADIEEPEYDEFNPAVVEALLAISTPTL